MIILTSRMIILIIRPMKMIILIILGLSHACSRHQQVVSITVLQIFFTFPSVRAMRVRLVLLPSLQARAGSFAKQAMRLIVDV
jgi:hypothetical protein